MITPDITLIHLSDTHLLPGEDDRMHGVDTDVARMHGVDTMANLRDALDLIETRGLRPDGFVVTGDLADAGGVASYERLRTVVQGMELRFRVPVVLTLGNHDKRDDFRAGYLGEAPTQAPYFHSERIGDLRVIALDSSVPSAPHGLIDAAQLEWLREELRTTAPLGTLLAFHHPPVPGPVPLINQPMLALRNPAELADVVRGSDVVGILAGHVHHPTWAVLDGIPCASAAATAYTVDPLAQGSVIRGIEGPSFGLVQMYGRTMVSTAVTLPSTQRELVNHEVTEEQVRRWSEAMRKPTQSAAAAS